MLRLGIGLVLVGLVATAQAAQPDEEFFAPRLNLITTRFVHSGSNFLPSYQFNASVVLIRPPDNASIGSGFGSAYPLPYISKLQQENVPAINAQWHQTYAGDSILSPRLLRVEFKVEQLNIALRFNSVTIDEKQLKIVLQPHSASMLWRTSF